MKCTPDGGGWGNGDGHADYTVYFYAKFSKTIKDYGIWTADIPANWTRKLEDVESDKYQQMVSNAAVLRMQKSKQGKHLGFYTQFASRKDEIVLMKAGISFVSIEGAKRNLQKEMPDWNFEAVQEKARKLWNESLGKMKVEGGTEDQKTVFYTALYHTMIDPRILTDVDGKYPGGDGKIHTSTKFRKRTIFSGWDVFRSQMPLQTLINPSLINDLANSLVELADQSGRKYFERWELLNAYSGCMIGNPAIPVIADAYAKGIRNFDVGKALTYGINTSEKFGNGDRGYTVEPFGISNTLEYGFDEWALSKLAGWLGKSAEQEKYFQRGQSYRNIFDKEKGWFRPRNADGTWQPWPEEGRLKQWYGSVECNPYQQGWFVPHDVNGMVELMGGREKVGKDLENFFNRVPENMMWNDYYNHANEPVHHVPYLFNRIMEPWFTQKWTRAICERAYKNEVEGLVGNEDVGQMSAWYVLAAAGFSPICPGETRYEITSPVFKSVKITLDPRYAKGRTFEIVTKNNSAENIYIQSALLNGKPYNKCFLDHADITAGGKLELVMGKSPNYQWGIDQ